MKDEWVLMGVVGVDSGNLMICDPCYLNDWEKGEYRDVRMYKDVNTGKKYQYRVDFANYESKMPDYDGKTPNTIIREGLWKDITYDAPYEFSYNYVTHREGHFKQINYAIGHAGLAVSFTSGLGDGSYEVWGRIRELPGWGERITEVKIKLVDDEEAAEILDYWNKTFWKDNDE